VVGFAAGLAALVRPNGIALVVGLVLGTLLLRRSNERARWLSLAAMALGLLLVLAPWTIRNAVVFHAFVPVSTGGGELLYMGTTPETGGRWDHRKWDELKDPVFAAERARLGHALNPLEQDRAFFKAGVANWNRDFTGSLSLTLKRIGRLCFVPVGADHPVVRIAFLVAILALYALALPMAIEGLRAREPNGAMLGVLAVTLLFNVVALSAFYTNSRYFEPFRPLLMVLAAGTIVRLWPSRVESAATGPRSASRPGDGRTRPGSSAVASP
jgi:hypothetical protein